jgi:predicted dehydrogenase
MPDKIYNWGIIATGGIAHKFAQDLVAHVPNARVHAVASRTLAKAQDFAQQYGASHAYGSYQELLQAPNLDIVYVATPHSEHYPNTLMCLQAGIPVLCEKPFTVNSTQLQELVALARQRKVFLQEAIWTRFHPSVAQVQAWIASGAIGEVKHIAADFGYKAPTDPLGRCFNPALTGGSLLDIGIYPLFISKLLLGKPQQCKAIGVMAPTGVDMAVSMALSFAGGATASLSSTFACNTDTPCHIYGTEGSILMHGRFHHATSLTLHRYDSDPQTISVERLGHGYSYEAQDAQRCLAQGRTENNLLTLDFSLELLSLMDDIRQQIGLHYPEDQV